MKQVETTSAVGHILCHDLTQIIPNEFKGARFRKGHVVTEEDIPVLLSMGKEHLYVWEKKEGFLHEDEAAEKLAQICENEHMTRSETKEGKIDLFASCDGFFQVRRNTVAKINSIGEIMIASRHGNTAVSKGDKLLGTRVIPLIIDEKKLDKAKEIAGNTPLFKLTPFKHKKAAILVTGNEVKKGLIEDKFSPVVDEKLKELGAETFKPVFVGDDPEYTTKQIIKHIENGAEIVVCTGGMSVDPDDKTPLAIKNTGAEIVSYGSPVLPGAMFLLAYYGEKRIPICGLPGCVMYSKRTVFDLVLPYLMADIPLSIETLAGFGEGGLCIDCPVCTYPNCGFGKGHQYNEADSF